MTNSVRSWTTLEVKAWLEEEGFEKYAELFCEKHEIDGPVLLALTENDLRLPPLQLQKLGDIKRLSRKIKKLRHSSSQYSSPEPVNHNSLAPPTLIRRRSRKGRNSPPTIQIDQSLYSASSCDPSTSEDEDYKQRSVMHNNVAGHSRDEIVFDPEYLKTFASFLYALLAAFSTSYTMVLVHDRVPDKVKHPPLPDIFLDNIPLIPYAFQLAELCGLVLMFGVACIIVFHKHRWIVLRRLYSIGSTVFLLRCITMFVTSLSVPGDHLQCQSNRYATSYARLQRALQIFLGAGMSITGVQTCGDYMFSGHTAVLTMLNHFITEYTPTRWVRLHIASWVSNLFGIFFILAAHEHYSIDVVIAFYITSRIFLYYHMLANTRSYLHSKRIRIWFPLLSYFECNVPGKVPNEFEWPITLDAIKRYCKSKFAK